MRLETMEIRDALTLYEAPSSKDTFFPEESYIFKLNRYVSMSEVPNSRTPGRRSQYILHGGANICGFLVWKLCHVTLDWNFEVRFSENLYTPDLLICMCAWMCVCVCVCRYNHSTTMSGGFCERGNETVFIQCRVLNGQLRNCYLSKKDSAPWSPFLYVMYVKLTSIECR